jgi:hypothetical protein
VEHAVARFASHHPLHSLPSPCSHALPRGPGCKRRLARMSPWSCTLWWWQLVILLWLSSTCEADVRLATQASPPLLSTRSMHAIESSWKRLSFGGGGGGEESIYTLFTLFSKPKARRRIVCLASSLSLR